MARGFLLALYNPRTMEGSLEAFERAIALDPKNAEAHHQYAQVLNWLERHDEADRELHLALTLDPGRAVSYLDLANTHFRETALALALIDSATALDPASPLARWWRALARLIAGDVRVGGAKVGERDQRIRPLPQIFLVRLDGGVNIAGLMQSDCLFQDLFDGVGLGDARDAQP